MFQDLGEHLVQRSHAQSGNRHGSVGEWWCQVREVYKAPRMTKCACRPPLGAPWDCAPASPTSPTCWIYFLTNKYLGCKYRYLITQTSAFSLDWLIKLNIILYTFLNTIINIKMYNFLDLNGFIFKKLHWWATLSVTSEIVQQITCFDLLY